MGDPFVSKLQRYLHSYRANHSLRRMDANHVFTATTLRTLLAQQAVTAMLSVGLVVALAAGVFDLSIAGTLGLSAIVVTKLMVSAGMVPSLAIIVALGAGVLIGAINALLIVVFRIDSFIATLAMQSVLAAMVLAVSGNEPAVGVPDSFSVLGSAAPLWVPLPVWYLVSVALAAWYVLEHTAMGRRIYATGGGREAARLAGVNVNRVVVASLLTASIVAAFSGIVVTARLGAGSPAIGPSYLLPAYAAAFLGATQIHRGRFNVWGTVLGSLCACRGREGAATRRGTLRDTGSVQRSGARPCGGLVRYPGTRSASACSLGWRSRCCYRMMPSRTFMVD